MAPVTASFPDAELEFALQKFLRKGSLPSDEMRPELIRYARKTRAAAMVRMDYKFAEVIHGAIGAFIAADRASLRRDNSAVVTQELKDRLDEAESARKAIEQTWKIKFNDFEDRKQRSLETMKQRHDADIRQFEEKWENPGTLLPFQKPSSVLLQVRKMQKAFALANEFAEARKFRLSGERMIKDESREANKKAALAMQSEYETMIEHHERDLRVWQQSWDSKRQELELTKAAELEINANLRKGIATRIAEPKLVKRSHVMLPITARGPSGMLTNRTRVMVANYRHETDAPKLEVQSSVRAFVKVRTKKSRQKHSKK
jgi:hypothetical protein